MAVRSTHRAGRCRTAACFFIVIVSTVLSTIGVRADGPTPAPTASTDGAATIHVVQAGETVFHIAQTYGTTVDAIVHANGLHDATQIQIGQRLLIPNVAPGLNIPSDDPSGATNGAIPGSPLNYIVQPGDSLFSLSWRYSTDVATIGRQNNIVNPARIYTGLSLSLKDGGSGLPPVKSGVFYTVQPGETLYQIAARYHVSADQLAQVNQLGPLAMVFPGQRLVIPGPADGPALLDVPPPFDRVAMTPNIPEQGRTMKLELTTTIPAKLSGQFMNKPLVVYDDAARTRHTITFGIDAFAKPGIYALNLTAAGDKGQNTSFSQAIEVADGRYQSESILLPPDQKDLLDPKVTQPESDKVMKIVSAYTEPFYLNGPMGLPCAAAVTSQFGTRRSYDGGPFDQWHAGTDFAAMPGSPIYAPAAGVVVMAETLHVRGNAMIINHGHGIYTGYWHQSEFKVKVGDIVAQGQVIGLVGGTGRATGPHLHWEMFVGGVQVDPLQWTRQNLS